MSIFQIIAIIFAGWMVYVTRIYSVKLKLSAFERFFWYSLWIIFAFIAIFPQTLSGISEQLQFARIFDLLIVGALMILSLIGVMNYFIQRDLSIKIEKLVRNRAIKNHTTKKKNAKK